MRLKAVGIWGSIWSLIIATFNYLKELMGEALTPSGEQVGDFLEAHIDGLERALGILTEEDRLLEAALVIDRRFLEVAAICDKLPGMERAFGTHRWVSHLEARLFAQEYADRLLTIDFMINLHQIFLKNTQHKGAPSITDSQDPRGSDFIDGEFVPFTCTSRQIANMHTNKLITWCPEPDDPHRGIIRYNVKSKDERLRAMQGICDWYNRERLINRPKSYRDAARLAATLQHRFISLHPLAIDFNGGVSRELMNWSLMNDGRAPSALYDNEADLFSTEEMWTDHVLSGSLFVDVRRQQLRTGEVNAQSLFGPKITGMRTYFESSPVTVAPPAQLPSDEYLRRHESDRFFGVLDLILWNSAIQEMNSSGRQDPYSKLCG